LEGDSVGGRTPNGRRCVVLALRKWLSILGAGEQFKKKKANAEKGNRRKSKTKGQKI